eukprot:TRINITY_DN106065_c0_g1_i1.p1 TRINITY_DN106065_c0_g1~~TRINITY_DN106065_c0_g1_i1.p1  ORF type:complete len:184 (-),score=19.50 TRINITY_DN106065_c0_g1_i1:276-827(-)
MSDPLESSIMTISELEIDPATKAQKEAAQPAKKPLESWTSNHGNNVPALNLETTEISAFTLAEACITPTVLSGSVTPIGISAPHRPAADIRNLDMVEAPFAVPSIQNSGRGLPPLPAQMPVGIGGLGTAPSEPVTAFASNEPLSPTSSSMGDSPKAEREIPCPPAAPATEVTEVTAFDEPPSP